MLLVFRTRDEDSAAILKGIANYTQQHGAWHVRVEDQAHAADESRWLLAQEWHGVISRHTTAALVESCAEFRVPLVDLHDSPQFTGVAKIRPDNGAVGVMGGEWFLDRGFRHLGFVGRRDHGWARERRAGFLESVRLGGRECAVLDLEAGCDGIAGSGAAAVRELTEWLRRQPKPLGVMACDDRVGCMVLEAARAAGAMVPEEVAVLGAGDDAARCELAVPSLSSVAPGGFQMGYRAAEQLALRLADRDAPVCDLRIEPAGVVARRSTDALVIPDRAVAAAARYIAEHACTGLTVNEVLPHAAVSRAQLEKKFRQYLGRSPQAEIRRVQVLRIRQLLVETDLPLKRIAELTGFDYMEYLCVVFRRLTGETPGAYRRRQQPGRPGAAGPAGRVG